jgi:hypothetical protein
MNTLARPSPQDSGTPLPVAIARYEQLTSARQARDREGHLCAIEEGYLCESISLARFTVTNRHQFW